VRRPKRLGINGSLMMIGSCGCSLRMKMTEIDHIDTMSLEPVGTDFNLVRVDDKGQKTKIFLRESDVIFLGPLFLRKKVEILSRHATPPMKAEGIEPVIMFPAENFEINTDLHESEVLLQIHDVYQNKYGFSFGPDGARILADALLRWAAKVETAQAQARQQ
jgi:hypothetical protein